MLHNQALCNADAFSYFGNGVCQSRCVSTSNLGSSGAREMPRHILGSIAKLLHGPK